MEIPTHRRIQQMQNLEQYKERSQAEASSFKTMLEVAPSGHESAYESHVPASSLSSVVPSVPSL